MKTHSNEYTPRTKRTRQTQHTTDPSTTGFSTSSLTGSGRPRNQRPSGKWVLKFLISATALFGVLNSAFLGFCLGVFVENTRHEAAQEDAPIEEAAYQTACSRDALDGLPHTVEIVNGRFTF